MHHQALVIGERFGLPLHGLGTFTLQVRRPRLPRAPPRDRTRRLEQRQRAARRHTVGRQAAAPRRQRRRAAADMVAIRGTRWSPAAQLHGRSLKAGANAEGDREPTWSVQRRIVWPNYINQRGYR